MYDGSHGVAFVGNANKDSDILSEVFCKLLRRVKWVNPYCVVKKIRAESDCGCLYVCIYVCMYVIALTGDIIDW